MLCDCGCENDGQPGFVPISPVCNYNGDLSCGICVCHEGYYGKHCECGGVDGGLTTINKYACRRDNTSTVDCSGRGTCECNMCNCNPTEEGLVNKFYV